MFNVKDDFRSGMPVGAVPSAWFNKVAAALNYFTVGMYLRFTRPDMPSVNRPFCLELDIEALRQDIGTGEITTGDITDWEAAVSGFLTSDDIGDTVAAQNHNHSGAYQPAGNYAAADHNHDGRYQPAGNYAAASHTHTASQVTDLGNAATRNVGTGSNNVAAGNHTHSDMVKTSDLRTALGTDGKVLTTNDVCAAGDIVPCGASDGHATVPPNHRHYHTYIVNSVATTAVKVLGWVANSAANTAASLISVFSPDTSKTGVVYNTKGTISYKSIGTTSGTVAAGDHTHGYAVLSASDYPADPVFYTNSSGNANNSSIGTKTTAARADHVHRLPDGIMILSYNQWVTGIKRFQSGKVRICADNSGTDACMYFRDAADNTTWAQIYAANNNLSLLTYNSGSRVVKAVLNSNGLYVYDENNNLRVAIGRSGDIVLCHASGGGSGVFFRYGGSTSNTAAITESASGIITITSANHARLSVAPIINPSTTGYNALQIATVGAIRDNFFLKDTSSTGIVRNAAGTLSYINNTNASQTVDVITDVTWSGTKLQKKKKTLTFQYGVLTSISAETTVDIDTAVTYNP